MERVTPGGLEAPLPVGEAVGGGITCIVGSEVKLDEFPPSCDIGYMCFSI